MRCHLTRRERRGCSLRVPQDGSLSLGRSAAGCGCWLRKILAGVTNNILMHV